LLANLFFHFLCQKYSIYRVKANLTKCHTYLQKITKTVGVFGLLLSTIMIAVGSPLIALAESVYNEIDKNTNTQLARMTHEVGFKQPTSIQKANTYLESLGQRTTVLGYGQSEFENTDLVLEIPFGLNPKSTIDQNQKEFEKTRDQIINQLSYSISNSTLEKFQPIYNKEISLEEAKLITTFKSINSPVLISKIEFQTFDSTPMKFQKQNNQIAKKALKKKQIPNTSQNPITNEDIEYSISTTLTNEERQKVLDSAKKTKESNKRKEQEAIIGIEQKKYKDQRIKESDTKELAKKQEIEQKIKEGKKSQITNEDIIALGKYSKDLGLEIQVSEAPQELKSKFEKDKQVKQEENRKSEELLQKLEIQNNQKQESKKIGWFDWATKIVNGFFGSGVLVSAFYPEINYENAYHSTANTHYATAIDLFNGNYNNGATIGLYTKTDGWNQKLYFYSDNIIRIGNKCLDASSGPNSWNGAKVHLWDCFGANWQKWRYDTEGRIRLAQDESYCLDSDNGSLFKTLYIWKCGNYTERFRSGEYQMGLMNRKSFGTGCYNGHPDCGHTFVYMAKYYADNYVHYLSVFSKWGHVDSEVNNSISTRSQFDQSGFTGNNIHFNNSVDSIDAYNFAEYGNTNSSNGNYAFWLKNVTYNQWYDSINGGHSWLQNPGYNFLPVIASYCTTYARNIWHKYNGMWLSGGDPYYPSPDTANPEILGTEIYY
jgi:Ricin-type beta-trefoil lectin domain